VHDLALERRHRRQPHRLAGLEGALGGAGADGGELVLARRAPAADVEHQPAADAGLAHDGQAGQLLHRLEHLAVLADQRVQAVADDRDDGALALDVHVDVAVDVGDVEQPLEVVAGDVALADEQVLPERVSVVSGSVTGVLLQLRVERGADEQASAGRRDGSCSCGRPRGGGWRRRRPRPAAWRRRAPPTEVVTPPGRRRRAPAGRRRRAVVPPSGPAGPGCRPAPAGPCRSPPLGGLVSPAGPGLPGLRLTGGIRLMTQACWPIDQTLVVSQ
jgi:hypothetical protein